MKVCIENRKLIVWLVLDALEETQALEVREHLRQCETCCAYHAEIAAVTLKISSLSDAAVAENLVRSDRSRRGSPAGPKRRNRRGADHSVRPVAGFNWGWVIPAFALVAFSLLVVSVLLRTPVNSQPFAARNQVAEKISASHELLPTLANYQAVANHSFDELDELLSRQAQKNVAAPPAPSARTLALLHLPD